MPPLPVGKLPAQLLQRLFTKYVTADPRVVVGPQVGEDAAVFDMGDRYLVATTDPITFATDEMGWYALHVNANDLAVRGATPRWFMATVLLPEGKSQETHVEQLFAELAEACAALGVSLVGGHTEVTGGLPRPIVVGAMLGEVAKDKLVTTGGAQVGDAVLLTKGVPLEGASIMARERGDEAMRRGVAADVVERARGFLRRPGISVVAEARAACDVVRVHAMHDPDRGWPRDRVLGAGSGRRRGTSRRSRAHARPARGPAALRGLRARSARHHRVGLAAHGGVCPRCGDGHGGVPRRRHRLRRHWPGDRGFRRRGARLRRSPAPMPTFPQDEITRIFRRRPECPRSVTRIGRRPWDGRAWSPPVTRSPRWPASRRSSPAAT